MDLIDARFRSWEALLQSQPRRAKRQDESIELVPMYSPAEQLANDAVQERWAQRYLSENSLRFGFTKVDGPFKRGPDFRVFHKRRWLWAEVETRWEKYLRHGHHLNRAFAKTEFLILLSATPPPPNRLASLPRRIIHMDRRHFLQWFEKASAPEMLGKEFGSRVAIVAGEMQHHWTTLCSDQDREMATCPDCDSCAYFGNGEFGEATPFYQELAGKLLMRTGLRHPGFVNLRNVSASFLRRVVEQNPAGD